MANLSCPLIALCLALGNNGAIAQQTADVEALEAAAQRGEVTALVTLAAKYKRGEDVARDIAKSNALYCKAAALGDTDALLELGLIYASGREMMPNEGVGALLINKAAELGNERAKELLPYISRGVGSTIPACLSEQVAGFAASPSVLTARKDIELLVQRWAPEYSIDPNFVLALIAVESKFDFNAVSPKNAQGLMQLIPATAERFGVKNAYNPLDNLKGGLAYLRWLMAYFRGDVALVLAAYNAGEEAVDKYLGVPPYPETRNYVKQITSVYKKASHPYIAGLVAPSSILSRINRAN